MADHGGGATTSSFLPTRWRHWHRRGRLTAASLRAALDDRYVVVDAEPRPASRRAAVLLDRDALVILAGAALTLFLRWRLHSHRPTVHVFGISVTVIVTGAVLIATRYQNLRKIGPTEGRPLAVVQGQDLAALDDPEQTEGRLRRSFRTLVFAEEGVYRESGGERELVPRPWVRSIVVHTEGRRSYLEVVCENREVLALRTTGPSLAVLR
jgi:hypothetical protein